MISTAYLKLIRKQHPELADLSVVYVSTRPTSGAFQDGWSKAATRIVAGTGDAAAPLRSQTASICCPGRT